MNLQALQEEAAAAALRVQRARFDQALKTALGRGYMDAEQAKRCHQAAHRALNRSVGWAAFYACWEAPRLTRDAARARTSMRRRPFPPRPFLAPSRPKRREPREPAPFVRGVALWLRLATRGIARGFAIWIRVWLLPR